MSTVTGRRDHLEVTRAPDPRRALSAERTLLAWFRLAIASFLVGLALVAFVPPGVATLPVSLVAGALMLGCAAAAVTGLRRWRRAEREHAGR